MLCQIDLLESDPCPPGGEGHGRSARSVSVPLRPVQQCCSALFNADQEIPGPPNRDPDSRRSQPNRETGVPYRFPGQIGKRRAGGIPSPFPGISNLKNGKRGIRFPIPE